MPGDLLSSLCDLWQRKEAAIGWVKLFYVFVGCNQAVRLKLLPRNAA